MEESFRLHTRSLFLTYSRCPTEWSKEFVRKKLVDEILIKKRGEDKYKSKVKAWVIAREDHQEAIGKGDYERGIHFHCLLELEKETNIRGEKMLDIEDEKGNKVHGNYQAVRDIFAVINYVKKHGDWIGEGFPGMKSRERAILSADTEMDAKLILMNKMKPLDQLNLRREYKSIKIKRTLVEEIAMDAPDYPYQEVLKPFERMKDKSGFNSKGRPIGLLLYGEPESGKTTLPFKISARLGEGIRIVKSMKSMTQHYNGEQIILLDEWKGEEFERYGAQISQMVTEPQATTVDYYGSKEMAWPRKVIVATNEDIERWKWTPALQTRFLVIKVKNNGEYQCKLWKRSMFGLGEYKLQDVTDEEIKEKLGLVELI